MAPTLDTLAASGLVLGALTAFAVLRMTLAGVPWIDSWLANLTSLSGPGGVNDPGELNPERYSLINLQYPLQSLGFSTDAANLITFTLVGAAALAMLSVIRGRDPAQELLALSTVAVLGLLVAYHRYYDAVILVLPIAWSFSVLGTTAGATDSPCCSSGSISWRRYWAPSARSSNGKFFPPGSPTACFGKLVFSQFTPGFWCSWPASFSLRRSRPSREPDPDAAGSSR